MVLIAYGKFINCGLACHDGADSDLLIPSELVLDLLKDVIFRVTTIYIYINNSNNNIIYNVKGLKFSLFKNIHTSPSTPALLQLGQSVGPLCVRLHCRNAMKGRKTKQPSPMS